MRKELSKELYPIHKLISSHNFRQFHFQLANGDSFYRFHNPDKFGDNLLDVRESIRIANVEKRYIAGFEEGRTFSGYRFVYPISYEGEHVGSVEISISPQGILEELYSLDSNRDIGFILSKEVMKETVFDDQQARYRINFISDEYVFDTEILAINEARSDSLKLHKNEAFLTQLRELVQEDLHKKLPISKAMAFDKKIYLIQFRPIKDISKETIGYFFSFKEDSQIKSFVVARKLVSVLSSIIMLILILLVAYMHNRQKEIQRVAMIDNLTSLYNRHSFYPLANRELARANRNNEPLSIAMLDIDYFKKINDTYGHTVGDQVLKKVARLIKGSIRETDILTRYGGEEFIILMPSTLADGAYTVAERIRSNIEDHPFDKPDQITISVGLSERNQNEKIDDIIDRADKALYEAKESGRNQTIIYRVLPPD